MGSVSITGHTSSLLSPTGGRIQPNPGGSLHRSAVFDSSGCSDPRSLGSHLQLWSQVHHHHWVDHAGHATLHLRCMDSSLVRVKHLHVGSGWGSNGCVSGAQFEPRGVG